jgi:hypothetical protein
MIKTVVRGVINAPHVEYDIRGIQPLPLAGTQDAQRRTRQTHRRCRHHIVRVEGAGMRSRNTFSALEKGEKT